MLEIMFRKSAPTMPTPQRLWITFLYYIFSLPGLILMVMGIMTGKVPFFLQCMWVVAWSAHIVMSVQWVRHVRLSKIWPVVGTVCGIGSLLMLVIVPEAMFIQLLLVSPGILLGFVLVKFHWAKCL
jgi:hypothetical protein